MSKQWNYCKWKYPLAQMTEIREKKKTSSEKCGEEETQKVSKKEKRWIMKRRNRWTQNTKKYAEEFKDNGEYQENM